MEKLSKELTKLYKKNKIVMDKDEYLLLDDYRVLLYSPKKVFSSNRVVFTSQRILIFKRSGLGQFLRLFSSFIKGFWKINNIIDISTITNIKKIRTGLNNNGIMFSSPTTDLKFSMQSEYFTAIIPSYVEVYEEIGKEVIIVSQNEIIIKDHD